MKLNKLENWLCDNVEKYPNLLKGYEKVTDLMYKIKWHLEMSFRTCILKENKIIDYKKYLHNKFN